MFAKRMNRLLALTVLLGLLCIPMATTSGNVGIVSDVKSPLQVSLAISKYPGLGQETTATCTLLGAWDMPNVVAEIELPEGATLVKGDLKWAGDLKANEPVSFEAVVTFHRTGNQGIKAKSLAVENQDTSWSDVAYAYLTVGKDFGTEGLMAFGGDPKRVQVEQVESGDAPALEEQLEVKLEGESIAPEPPALDSTAAMKESGETPAIVLPQGNLIVTGRWMYYNRSGSQVPQPNMLVQLVRGNNNNWLAWAYTDSNGYFTFPAVSNPGSNGIKVRVHTYVKWAPNNYELMMVRPGGGNWTNAFWGETSRYVFSDGTRSVGTWSMVRPSQDATTKAWWGQVDLRGGFLYPPNQPGGSIVEWSPTSTHGTHYHVGGHIHLMGGDLDVPHVILHEYAHNVMYKIYRGYFPSNDCPSPHYINRYGGPHCGWTEGWAEFFPMAVLNDTSFRWPGGGSLNLETPTWFASGWDNGDRVEGRVAGTLWDTKDSANDGYDQYSDGFNNIWAAAYNQTDDTFSQFWSAWQSRGYNQRTFRAAAFQNTIDYGYKPKLTLTWGATPPDLDLHMWLPSSNRYHVYFSAKGSLTAFPWANLDVDDTNGYGPENITIAKPYNGTYVVAVDRYYTSGNIAGTGARLSYYLGSYFVTSWTVPSSGTGRWWYVADINGYTGGYTTRNTIRTSTPGPYAISPAGPNGDEKPK